MKDLIERLKAWADPISSGYEVPRAGQALLEAADALERLTAENAALRKDAERYRWLRDKKHPSLGFTRLVLNDTPHGIDAAIDAAMGESHE